jgi:hypothetical protein
MPLLAILSLAVQIFFVVHVFKTGRNTYWVFLIIFVPLIGCAAYFIVEILPGLRHNRQMHRAKRGLLGALDPMREVRRLRDNLEAANTTGNRLALADACLDAGIYAEAAQLYQACLKIETHNPELMRKLAQAQFADKQYPQARQTLDELIQHNPGYKSHDGHLLYARTLEALGDSKAAAQEYQILVEGYPGEEARIRYAMLLKSQGEEHEAAKWFNEVVRRAGRSPKYYRRAQQQWIDIAKQNI